MDVGALAEDYSEPGQLPDLSEVRANDAHRPRRQIRQASLLSLLVKHLLQVVEATERASVQRSQGRAPIANEIVTQHCVAVENRCNRGFLRLPEYDGIL